MHNIVFQLLTSSADVIVDQPIETWRLNGLEIVVLAAGGLVGCVFLFVLGVALFKAQRVWWSLTPQERKAARKQHMDERVGGDW